MLSSFSQLNRWAKWEELCISKQKLLFWGRLDNLICVFWSDGPIKSTGCKKPKKNKKQKK